MKTNHLLASAAISAMLVATLPAHAQILGGVHGGGGGMQSAAFGGGFGGSSAAARGMTDMSAVGRTRAPVTGLGHADHTAQTGTQAAARDAGHTKGDAAVARRQASGAGDLAGSNANDIVVGTTRPAASSTATTTESAAGQGEAQARRVNVAGVGAAGESSAAVPGAKPQTSSERSAGRVPANTKPGDGAGSARRSSAASPGGVTTADTGDGGEAAHGAGMNADADTNASVSASAAH
jgi:hypothetical protein